MTAEVARAGGKSSLTEHFAIDELHRLARSAKREAVAGGVLVLLSTAALLLAVQWVPLFRAVYIFIGAGVGMLAHGLGRRHMVRRALLDTPVARVVRTNGP